MPTGPVLIPVAEEIARYIREAQLERPAIVGHSMGGSWAILVAGRHPGLVSQGDGGRHDALSGRDVPPAGSTDEQLRADGRADARA